MLRTTSPGTNQLAGRRGVVRKKNHSKENYISFSRTSTFSRTVLTDLPCLY
jgi:hypothetical protein